MLVKQRPKYTISVKTHSHVRC